MKTNIDSLINKVKQFSTEGWALGVCHGVSHWERVERNGLLLATDDEFELLRKACELHTVCHRTGNATIDACFDADRLDLMRVGIIPDPKKMATERGAFYAANMKQFYADTGMKEDDYKFFD